MKFACLVVTYNRLEKLKKALLSYDRELLPCDTVIIVDNGSQKEVKKFLQDWLEIRKTRYEVVICTLEKNVGATYGFKTGLIKAQEMKIDWCLICDDDAYLGEDFIKRCKTHISASKDSVGAICSKVVSNDNSIQFFHRRIIKKQLFRILEKNATENDYLSPCFSLNLFSFVGVCLRMSIISNVGFPDSTYYIWYDDTEFSLRVQEKYQLVCYPDLTVIHDCDNQINGKLTTYKEYYGYRNRLFMLKKHFPSRYYRFYLLYLRLKSVSNKVKCPLRAKIIKDSIADFKNNVGGPRKEYLPSSFNKEI